MDDSSPLEAAAGVAGPRTIEAFSILGNETRLSILLALWEAFEPLAEENAMAFSELRDRVGMRDSGQFNYHLDQLTGQFLRQTDAGYELRQAGQKLVRVVIAGTGIGQTTVSPVELDLSCHRCGAYPVELRYEEETIYVTCMHCEGFLTAEELPRGTLAVWDLDPAGVANRDPSELFLAGAVASINRLRMMREGVCPDCSGVIETSLRVCDEHRIEGGNVCPNCDARDSARVRYACTVCKNWTGGPIEAVTHDHPAVVSFYYEHGVDIRYGIEDVEGLYRVWELVWNQEHTVVSADPIQVRVTVPCEGDTLDLLVDETFDVEVLDDDG